MTSERWLKVKEIFHAALEVPPDARRPFVQTRCGDDEALCEEIELLLSSHAEAEDFIEAPALAAVTDLVTDEQTTPVVGQRLGAYKIESEIGRGGMGAVYLATRADDQYHKCVAIKLIKRGLDTDEIIRRFRHERQILAALDHPHITRLLDGGTTEDGLPYLVMDYVEGSALNRYCDERQLPVAERLKLFLQICSAVSYAHQNLIIHRDLKPSNILVTEEGTPKLLDFGIAKLTSSDGARHTLDRTLTATHALTPEYASPEQVLGQPVTTATDIYSLGVVLYELLTGHRPFRLRSHRPEEITRAITDTEPPRPSTAVNRHQDVGSRDEPSTRDVTPEAVSRARGTQPERLRRTLRGDLDNIVLMALRKEPERRYSSVEQFAADIRRHMDGLPVIARQDTFGYRASKFIKRNKAAVAAGTGIALSLVAGIAATTRQTRIARQQRDKAERVNRFLQKMLGSADPRAQGRDVTVVQVLELAAQSIETDFADQPEVNADLHTTIGLTYLSLGLVDSAEPHLRAALDTRLQLFERGHHDVAMSLKNLGSLLQAKGDLAGAEPVYREALASIRRLRGGVHLEVASILNSLGYLLALRGEVQESLRLHRQELAIRYALVGEIHPTVARTLMDLASVLVMLGATEEAEPLLRQSLAIARQFYPEDHPDVAQILSTLARSLLRQNTAEAEELFRKVLAIQRKLMGHDHPDVAWTLYNLAHLMSYQGRCDEGAQFAQEVLSLRGRTLADEHPVVSSAMQTLAICLMQQGKPEEAEPLFQESLTLRRRTLPPDHWLLATSHSLLGECLAQLGQHETAEQLLLESYEALKARLGAQHERTRDAFARIEQFRRIRH
jgi:serine/threonine-protein kinase